MSQIVIYQTLVRFSRVGVISLAVALFVGLSVGAAEPQMPAGKEFTNSLGMKLVRIEPGEFLMGEGDAPPKSRKEWESRDWDESPAHKVRITRPFYLGACELTNAQYEEFDPAHKEWRGKADVSRSDREPVTFVTWQQAVDFCRWLSKKEGRAYRLPTEAEWEYACRAGTTTIFSTGETLTAKQANVGLDTDGDRRLTTVPVGGYAANPWGLFDMHGNVEEWCLDWYGPYEAGAQTDPVGRADGHARVTRGGSYNLHRVGTFPGNSRYCRSSNRSAYLPEDANRCVGFRVVLGEIPQSKPLPPAPLPLHQRNVKQTRSRHAPRAEADGTRSVPATPYFVDFTAANKNPTIPAETWGPIFSHWNHFSAVCVCPNGDVLAAWYSTVSEEGREVALAGSRLRAGADAWEPASLFFDVPDVNDHAPVLFCDGQRLYHFSTQGLSGWDDASNIVRTSDDSGATWSKPRIILNRHDPQHLSQACSALRAKDGTLVLAVDGDNHKDERTMTSRDGGQTWQVGAGDMRKTCGRYVIHPAAVQLDDGSLLAFLRGPHPMPAVLSKDMGASWQERPTPFPGISGGQKAAALKLAGGALLLCGADSKKQLVGGGTYAALSLDDGRTWPHVRKVEGVGGYMSLALAPDGVIYLFGTRMGCAAFNEAWLREGKPLGAAQK